MNLNLDTDQMTLIVRKAILDLMPDEKRDQLVADAVQSLLKSSEGWNHPTKLKEAFDIAVSQLASEAAREVLDDGNAKQRIKDLFVEAFEKSMAGDNYEKLTDKIAGQFSNALWDHRY